jgi:hypothetical protein
MQQCNNETQGNFNITQNHDAIPPQSIFDPQSVIYSSIPDPVSSQDCPVGIPSPTTSNQMHRCQGPWNPMVLLSSGMGDQWDQSFYLQGQDYVSKPPTQFTSSESSFNSTRARANSPIFNSLSYSHKNLPIRPSESHSQRNSIKPVTKADRVVWKEVILSSSQQSLGSKFKSGGRRKLGRRTGPLGVEAAKKAAHIRKIRSCWQCWLSKVPVSLKTLSSRSYLTILVLARARERL